MKKLLIALCLLPLAVMGQEIKFDTQDYKSVGVYDRWEHSPFRTGELAGNCAVVNGPSNGATSLSVSNTLKMVW